MPDRGSVVVDSKNGPIKSIEKALENIKPNTTIYLGKILLLSHFSS